MLFTLAIRRDFLREAVFLWRVLPCKDWSIRDKVEGSNRLISTVFFSSIALFIFFNWVRNLFNLLLLAIRFRSLCRALFSADLWLAIKISFYVLETTITQTSGSIYNGFHQPLSSQIACRFKNWTKLLWLRFSSILLNLALNRQIDDPPKTKYINY